MKQRSLSRRLFATLFGIVVITTTVSMVAVELFVNDVEDTIRGLELKLDAEYFKGQITESSFQTWKTGRIEAYFLPSGAPESLLPQHLHDRPIGYSDEIEFDDWTKILNVETTTKPPGRLYVSEDITIMENREAVIQIVLLVLAAGLMLLGLFVSGIASSYLLKPLRALTHDVQSTEPGVSMQRLSRDYRDREFDQIADAFNRFLSAMETVVEREKSFVKLASHEFRTPLAVIMGALDVLEQRKTLSEADQKTLGRIRRSTRTMREDTEMLLRIARGEQDRDNPANIDIVATTRELLVDLKDLNPAFNGRTVLHPQKDRVVLRSDPALVRMIIRNLVQNALGHTNDSVDIFITDHSIRIQDFGKGLSTSAMEAISTVVAPETRKLHQSSFGLLIVQLACERIHWGLQVEKTDSEGTVIVIDTQDLPH